MDEVNIIIVENDDTIIIKFCDENFFVVVEFLY